MSLPAQMDALISSTRADGLFLDFTLEKKPTPQIKKPTDVIIRVEAAPINPSDVAVIFGGASRLAAHQGPSMLSAPIPPEELAAMAYTVYGQPRKGGVIPGNEGSGVVVAVGTDSKVQHLLGKTVAFLGTTGGGYATYIRKNGASEMILPMPAGVTPQQCASSFVNPLTALGLAHTVAHGLGLHKQSHTALVHTAAASQLGQMLVRICMQDKIALVNVVRKPEHIALLKSIDPNAICVNQSLPSFLEDLASAIKQTSASLCFDATGGGSLASQILEGFEMAGQVRDGVQIFHYGILDSSPSTLTAEQQNKAAWWLLMNWKAENVEQYSQNIQRVASEITTTFATNYTAEVGLAEAVTLPSLGVYGKQETGKKYLLTPQKIAIA